MKAVGQALAAQIFAGQFVDWDIYTILLAGGGVLAFTSADFNIVYNNLTWLCPRSSYIGVDDKQSKTQAHWKVGFDVDDWTVNLLVDPRATLGGQPFVEACQAGALDFAEFKVRRAVFNAPPAWPIPVAGLAPVAPPIPVFHGMVAEVDAAAGIVRITANDFRALLQFLMPRNFFQAGCAHQFCDVGCQLSIANYTQTVTARAGSTPASIKCSPSFNGQPANIFVLGTITGATGANAGFARTVLTCPAGGPVGLMAPLPFPVAAGDTFTLSYGCDKTMATCQNIYSNLLNFGGQPFIPSPELAS